MGYYGLSGGVRDRGSQRVSRGMTMRAITCLSLCVLGLGAPARGKICWQGCQQDQDIIQTVNIEGCRRRSTYPAKQDFWCKGQLGPPCTVKRGDTVHLEVDWHNPGVRNMR